MAKQLSFTDSYGDTYAESYWRVENVRIDKKTQTVHFEFVGYPDALHKGGRTIGTVLYNVGDTDYETYFSPTVLDSRNPIAAAYVYADDKPGTVLGEGMPRMFFTNANDI